MPHTFAIQILQHAGDVVTVGGTVDGVFVTAFGSFAQLTGAPSALAAQTIIAGWLLAAFQNQAQSTAIYNGTIVV